MSPLSSWSSKRAMPIDQKPTLILYAALAILTMSCGGGGGGSSPAAPSPQPPPTVAPAPTVSAVSPALGPTGGGLNVTISGNGFTTGATVSIGGAAASSVTVAGATSITATTPPHAAGATDVVVTNPDGQSGRIAGAFNYEVPVSAPPSVSSVGPTSGPVSGGTSVTLTGTGFVSGATIAFGTTKGIATSVSSSSSLTATTPAGLAGPVDLVVTNPDGQSGKLAAAFNYVGSSPAPAPTPPATTAPTVSGASPASGSTAGGTVVTLNGNGFAAGAAVSFGGTAATGVAVASATSITATAPAHAAGSVDIVVTNSDGLSGRLSGGFTYNAPAPVPTPPAATVVVTITPAGVSPSVVTIAPGARVRFVNNDAVPHAITSDPHPDHTDCPPINNVGLLLAGQAGETAAFTTIRSCNYHDHNDSDNPKWTGTIQVRASLRK